MIRFNCPNCNAELVIRKENREAAFCEYCGQRILLEKYRSKTEAPAEDEQYDVIKWSEERKYEAARIRRDAEKKEYMKIWAVFFGAAALLAFIFALSSNAVTGLLVFMYTGGIVAAVGIVVIYGWLPEKENRTALACGEKVRFPQFTGKLTNKNYRAIRNELYNAGFLNVTCINMHDVKLGIMQKNERIESVTIDDKEVSFGGKVYSADAKVVIRYHGR